MARVSKTEAEQTRQRLLQAAYEEIHVKGYQAAGINDILARAGVTKGAMYHHFPSKQALGYAMVEEVLGAMLEEFFFKPVAAETNFVDGFRRAILEGEARMGAALVAHGCPLNNLAQEMSAMDEGFRQRIDDHFRHWREGIAAALRASRDAGWVRAEVDPEQTALFLQAALEGCVGLGKNAQSRVTFRACLYGLLHYLETLRAQKGDMNHAGG